MALPPSRPGFMIAGALFFLVLPFVWASFTRQPIDRRLVAFGVVMALVFLMLGAQYRRQRRARASVPPTT